MGKSRKRGEKSNEENEQTLKELKASNRRLKSDNERLKSELATLEEAFFQTSKYIKGNTDNISVEKIVEGIKKGSTLESLKKKDRCEKCGSDDIKEMRVIKVGTIVLCAECKYRKVVKNEKEG